MDLEGQSWTWRESSSTQLHSFPISFHLSLEAFRNDQVIYLIIVAIKASETIYLACQVDKRNKSNSSKNWNIPRTWRPTPSIPALRRQKQVDFYEFKASLVYKESSRQLGLHRATLSWKTKTTKSENQSIPFFVCLLLLIWDWRHG